MAERSLIQYQPVTGPVWREPVASRLQWLPEGQQPARGLQPNRLGDFVRPEFAALYVQAGLQWTPDDRYAGQLLPYSLSRNYVLDPIPPANPRLLDWQSRDQYAGKALPRNWPDWSVYPLLVAAPAYDPQNLEWMPRGIAPQNAVERRILGDFQQPAFDTLPPPYNPRTLEWEQSGFWQPNRTLAFIHTGDWIIDPTTPPAPPPVTGQTLYPIAMFPIGMGWR